MAEEADLRGLRAKFDSIGGMANRLLERIAPTSRMEPRKFREEFREEPIPIEISQHIMGVVQNYKSACGIYPILMKDSRINPDYVDDDLATRSPVKILEIVRSNCESAIAAIDSHLRQVTPEEADRLRSLRQQIGDIENVNVNLHKHLERAIQEYEAGHHLASALISGKTIDFSLNQLAGKDDEEKAKILSQHGLLDEKLRTGFLKASRRARAFFSHDLNAIPEPQEALELLAGAVNISLLSFRANQEDASSRN